MLACVLISQTGCAVWHQARMTVISEPSAYSWKWDRSRSLKAYRRWADEAWLAERGGCPDVAGDADYALGFRDGFVDYVYAGGDGQPPPVPPRRYWNVALRGPAGKGAAAQWFAGYRHGANVARGGGYRENGIVASSYAWGGAVAWDGEDAPAPIASEELMPADELLPEPAADDASDAPTEHVPALPEFTLPPIPPVDAEPNVDRGTSVEEVPDASLADRVETPAEDAPADEAPEDISPTVAPTGAVPAAEEPAANEPEASPESIFDLGPPTTRSAPRASRSSARAIERFRRAVSTVQFVEPRTTK
jgi:hypothetical protein